MQLYALLMICMNMLTNFVTSGRYLTYLRVCNIVRSFRHLHINHVMEDAAKPEVKLNPYWPILTTHMRYIIDELQI